ncbi:MAG: ATPase, T2SS/T4P/T4SS family [Lachnospiraceae bacterium]|nr:ATPase, T2SS/T4P/T4SS family [Lachnospiraceae bacterium]
MDSVNSFRNVRIGDVLKEYGYVTDEQIGKALDYQKEHKGMRLGGALIELGFITERQMLEALAARLDLKIGDVSQMHIDMEAVRLIPAEMSQRYRMLGVAVTGDTLTVLTNDPLNFYGLEDVRQTTGLNLEILLCEGRPLDNAIRYYYAEVKARRAASVANDSQRQEAETLAVEESDDDTPVINLLNSLVQRAYHSNASDIHIEPFEDKTTVRMRIDGVIIDFVTLQKSLHASLIARVKILGDMDIAERRLPQDGHFRMKVDDTMVNMRISVLPTVFGEKAVIRLLASNSQIDHSGTYGMQQEDFDKLNRMLRSPNGLIYMTGPTGSGKTTTLYMILNELAKRQVNISTIEDPVEKNLARINQSQVNNLAGMTFENGLRALLRQDPDIIMVGETRDSETASISVRAAITGHLVLSTLHTNDAVSAIVRLQDMGVEKYMVANSLVGVVAQRLMRKLCPDCAQEVETDEETRVYLGADVTKIKVPKGCSRCNNTGYRGRVAIHEVLFIDKELREMIAKGADMEEIKTYAHERQNMVSLKDGGARLVAEGVTSLEELFKVAYYE